MGGGSNSNSSSSTDTQKTYKNTTTSNPYVVSNTNDSGTTTRLQDGTSLKSIFDFTNNNIDSLLNQYLNPSIDNELNQNLLATYQRNLADETRKNLENNIIAPLTQRNMLRSSQATDLYNQLAKQQTDSTNDYITTLLSNSQNNTGNLINNLMNLAFQGYNVISGNQAQSLNTSAGNATTNTKSTGKSSTISYGM